MEKQEICGEGEILKATRTWRFVWRKLWNIRGKSISHQTHMGRQADLPLVTQAIRILEKIKYAKIDKIL